MCRWSPHTRPPWHHPPALLQVEVLPGAPTWHSVVTTRQQPARLEWQPCCACCCMNRCALCRCTGAADGSRVVVHGLRGACGPEGAEEVSDHIHNTHMTPRSLLPSLTHISAAQFPPTTCLPTGQCATVGWLQAMMPLTLTDTSAVLTVPPPLALSLSICLSAILVTLSGMLDV